MSSATIHSSTDALILDSESNFKAIAKTLLAVTVVVGLVAAVFFSSTALIGLAAAGAASWQIGLTAVGCAASSISLLGSGYFAAEHEMFRDTGKNGSDTLKFLRDTFASGFHLAAAGINIVREWQIWDIIRRNNH